MTRSTVSVVITDLDNTLYDWLKAWAPAFQLMLSEFEHRTGISCSVLEQEAHTIHQQNGSSEYGGLVDELPSLRRLHPTGKLHDIYADIVQAYQERKANNLRLFDGVRSTLDCLSDRGCLLVGYTEASQSFALERVRRLGLDHLLDYVYAPPSDTSSSVHKVTDLAPMSLERRTPLPRTRYRQLDRGSEKPGPETLLRVMATVEAPVEGTIYIGDSLVKDIAMAQEAGVTDVYAAYGEVTGRQEYEQLRRVSHWSDRDIALELDARAAKQIVPTYTLEESFAELLDLFDFGEFQGAKHCPSMKRRTSDS